MHWSTLATSGQTPKPFCKHTATLVGSKIFFFGGSSTQIGEDDEEIEVFNDLVIFDTETHSWWSPPQTGDLPGRHRAHTATLVDTRLFIFGGGDGPNYFNHVYILDTKTFIWTKPKVTGTVPGPRRAHTATAVGNKIYVFGGGDGNSALAETFVFETDKMHWSVFQASGAVKPDPRGYHTATQVGNKIIFFGGSDTQACFSDMLILDTDTRTWSKKRFQDTKCRYAHTATLVGPWLLIFGGCDGGDYVSDLACLNLEDMQWQKISISGNIPAARGYHTAIYHDSRVFVYGGSSATTYFDDMCVLELGSYAYLPMHKFKVTPGLI